MNGGDVTSQFQVKRGLGFFKTTVYIMVQKNYEVVRILLYFFMRIVFVGILVSKQLTDQKLHAFSPLI